jgi:hypothetical protein
MTAPEPTDWSLVTFEGLRRAQHEAFRALSFREKLLRLEEMDEVAKQLAAQIPAQALAPSPPQPLQPGPPGHCGST